MTPLAVIIPAAGSSTRFAAVGDKLLQPLCGQTVLARTLNLWLARADVMQVVVPTRDPSAWEPAPRDVRSALADPRVLVCIGGTCRAHSVQRALDQVKPDFEWVAIHDGARPLASNQLIDRTFAGAQSHGAAVPAMAVHLTIKQATGPLPALVEHTVPRQKLWAVQTPQIVRRLELLEAFGRCPLPLEQVTDDVQLLELAGFAVCLVPGEERNLKLTTPQDLRLAQLYLETSSATL